MTDHRHADDVAAYALGALTELETAAFERHLMRCDTCARELERLRVAVDALPAAVPYHPAPPELKASVMEVVTREAAERSGAGAGASAEPARRPRWRLPALLRSRPAMAFAAGLALVALVLAGYGIGTSGSDDRQVVAASVDERQVPGAQAQLVAEGDVGVLSTQRLPATEGDDVYVVWVDRGDGPVYESAFDVQPDGRGEAAVADLEDVDRVMVTREASTAVAHPTSSPLLTAELS